MHIDHPLRFVLQVTQYRSRQMLKDLQTLFERYANSKAKKCTAMQVKQRKKIVIP